MRHKLRLEVLAFFGGKCVRCGFSDWRALQIDRINGGASRDSASKGKAGVNRETAIRKLFRASPAVARAKYQCLCANCNSIKRHEKNEFHRRCEAPGVVDAA